MGKHWIGTHHFDCGFGLEASAREIRPEAACNAPAHSSHLIQGYLAKHNISLIRQAPYSPDMAPCDFWLFPKLKMPLKGTRFESREDIMRNATAQLDMIPQEAFQKCFQQWQDRWKKCVHYQGDYFEGD